MKVLSRLRLYLAMFSTALSVPTMQAAAAETVPDAAEAFVLSIDGGGVNGLLPALVLEQLGECLKGHGATDQLARQFDLIAGTSTGSIITAALVTPRDLNKQEATSPSEIVELFRKQAQTIFPDAARLAGDNPWPVLGSIAPATRLLAQAVNRPVYSDAGLRAVLGERLREHTNRMALTHYLITGYETFLGPVSFVTEGMFRDSPTGQRTTNPLQASILMTDQVLASTAAPTFLPSQKVHSHFDTAVAPNAGTLPVFDGGLYAVNPALLAVTEARRVLPPGVKINLLSLGTGIDPKQNHFGYVGDPTNTPAFQLAVGTIKALMVSQVRQVDDFLKQDPNIAYTRIDPLLPDLAGMADASTENMVRLEGIGRTMLAESESIISAYCATMIRRRSYPSNPPR